MSGQLVHIEIQLVKTFPHFFFSSRIGGAKSDEQSDPVLQVH